MPARGISVNGVRYNVEVEGSGPPLLLLHGFTGSGATWSAFVAAARSSFTTIAPDLMGHGATDVPEDLALYSMDRWAEDLYAILDQLGHPVVSAMGYSMGGRTLVCAACRAPHRFEKLVLEGATPGLDGEAERQAQRRTDEALAATIEEKGVPHFVDLWEKKLESHKQPQELRERLRAERLKNSPRGLANALRGVGPGAQPPQRANLGRLTMPTLLVVGGNDTHFQGVAAEMSQSLPNARTSLVPGAGHTAHVDQPDAFNRIVIDFLR